MVVATQRKPSVSRSDRVGYAPFMLTTIAKIVVIGIVVGVVAELIRTVPDPDLRSRSGTGGVIAGVVAGALAGVVVTHRPKKS